MPRMPASLRCVFYDPDAVDAGSHLTARAFEACARAEVAVFELKADDAVELDGELQGIAFVMRALNLSADECIGVGAALAEAPVGTVWVSPLAPEVRGPPSRLAAPPARRRRARSCSMRR